MIRALIFDFDGLIVDSETAVAGAWREIYAQFGLDFPEDLWRRMVGTRDHDDLLWSDLATRASRPFDAEELEGVRRRRGVELANALDALPGVIAHLDAARADGLGTAVASSSSRWWVEHHLERLGLADRFDAVCTKEDASRGKPDPAIYRVALSRLRSKALATLAYEDTEAGVASAKAAGVRVVAVPGSFSEHMDFSAADRVVASLAHVEPRALWDEVAAGAG